MVIAVTMSRSGITGDVYDTYLALCKQSEQKPLTQRRVTQIISELELLGLVSTDVISQGRYGRSQKIKVMVPQTTVSEALKEDFASLID